MTPRLADDLPEVIRVNSRSPHCRRLPNPGVAAFNALRTAIAVATVVGSVFVGVRLVAAKTPPSTDRGIAGSRTADADKQDAAIDFTRDIQPILAKHCYACHGPDVAEGGLRLSDSKSAFALGDSGDHAIVPGDPAGSPLLDRVTSRDEFEKMPPEGERVSADEASLLRRWIQQGARWKSHWAFAPATEVTPPVIENPLWSQNPIDRFLYAGLQEAGLKPNPPASKRALIRRAYYDLIGLPPTKQEVDAFTNDPSPDAFRRVVQRLLDSPHYGERWGRHWLDLVRYAETNSFERDGVKPNAWKYRDYVIQSFNQDKPYDVFLREQIAGDQLDHVDRVTLTATGFYRLGIWDDEPADPLQAKHDAIDDILTTVSQVFLGLTVNCARCHDHKIDPIPQTDYYSLAAFFSDITPYAKRSDLRTNNQIDVSKPEVADAYTAVDATRSELRRAIAAIEQRGIANMSATDQRQTEGPKRERQRVLEAKLKSHLTPQQWREIESLRDRLAAADDRRTALPPRESVLGLAVTAPESTETFVLFRGNPHAPAARVDPAFPELFKTPAPDPATQPNNHGRRRVLADWITSPENLLASRVIANRIWQYHFGRGIVRSSNNFGRLGTPPTHPELLDWLAEELVQGDWKLKSLHQKIMTSRAYQMASTNRDSAAAIDPANDLFWRFDPRRLSAEEIRDSILLVNQSLNRKVFGPSVFPKLSAEVLAGQSRPGSGWGQSSPADRNRRSIYIHVKRSLLTPLLSVFDFPEPDQSCEARFVTLQPGQALSLLNSSFIHAQARELATSIHADRIGDDAVVRACLAATLARDATEAEVRRGVELITALQDRHAIDRPQAVTLYCLSVMNWNEFLFLD